LRQNKKVWTKILAVDLLMLCVSFSMSVIGQMRDKIEDAYGLTATQGGLLLSVQSIGGFAVTVIAMVFIDAFNKRKLIVAAGVLTSLLIMAIGIGQPLFTLFVVYVMLGFFAGIIKTLVNAVMYDTVLENAETHMTLLHLMFSLASVIGPLAAYALYISTGISGVFFILGGVSMACALYAGFAFRKSFPGKMRQSSANVRLRFSELKNAAKKPGMAAIATVSLLVSMWQVAAIYTTSSYLSQLRGNDSHGATALSVLFLGMMLARGLFAKAAGRFSQIRVLAVGSAAGAACWLAMLFVPDVTAKIVLIGVSALMCGNNIPITYMIGCKIAPEQTATASGIISFGFYLALFVFVPVVSALGDAMGMQAGLIFAALPLVALIPFAVRVYRVMRRADSA